MPLQWVVVVFLVGVVTAPVGSQEVIECPWLDLSGSSDCVKSVDCTQASGYGLSIWEDCRVGEELFTITDDTVQLSDCSYLNESAKVIFLAETVDAEDTGTAKDCSFTGLSWKLYISAANINEFSPNPTDGTVSTMEVDVDENSGEHDILNIYYSDADKDETVSLTCEQISIYEDTFKLEPAGYAGDIKTFQFSVFQSLDFETQMFYKVEYDIISTDERGNEKKTRQTFLLNVKDKPDNPPFWSLVVPFFQLEECRDDDNLFPVAAQDRDVDVGYDIKYSLQTESDYFKIDETTGQVSRYAEVDREALLEEGVSFFSLVIIATEYKPDGTVGEEPNTNEQVTTITVLDCNDQVPTFNQPTYDITIDELTRSSVSQALTLDIVVKDMDEGTNGSFTLKTNDPERLSISPESGKQTQEVQLTALFQDEPNNYFNYEVHQDKPLTFTITATEDANASHTSTATITILLRDVNDNAPEFTESSYAKDLPETTIKDTLILTVNANDADIHDDIGTPSIRYSLGSSCQQLAINDVTGKVTLAMVLDFDDSNTDNAITCLVNARDRNGTGLQGSSEIAITVLDVVDEPPQFKDPVTLMEITEDNTPGTDVGSFTVTDADEGADITFTIESSDCSKGTTPADIEEWFAVNPDTPSHPNYPAKVTVGSVKSDREVCSEVTLTVSAVDEATEANKNSATGTVIITIKDTKDEPPVFNGNYKNLNIDEFDENQSHDSSVEVFVVRVSDPDEGDTISLAVSKGEDLVKLSVDEVTVDPGEEAQVVVQTLENAVIDRETQDSIQIEITLTDSSTLRTTQQFIVSVNDLNDKKPVMAENICDQPFSVHEDDGTGSQNGTVIHTIFAEDGDQESPYNTVHYMMMNDQLTDSKNQLTPFTVDENTGVVSILLIDNKKVLDREQYADWELIFQAYDACDSKPSCKVLSSEQCKVTITVLDVNDNYPRDLEWLPNEDIRATDFLKKDDKLDYLLFAYDDDEGDYADLTYSVVSTVLLSGDQDMGLFRAEHENAQQPSCSLYANEDFEGKNYTGTYNVTLQATDGGGLSTNFSIAVYIVDANDEVPHFVFDRCSGQDANTIKMEENAYTPGENGEPDSMEVKCDGPGGPQFNIKVQDTDTDQVNRDVTVEIDVANSTVENLQANEQELLSYWSLEPKECVPQCNLKVSHIINREEGTAYNLSLHVRNTAEPLKESWATVRVVVTNIMEFPPYFCTGGKCSQTVSMIENDPGASAVFMEATDEDNNGVSPGDDGYDDVYYFIVDGDMDHFEKHSDNQRQIFLKDMPKGLDREAKSNYSLKIHVSNDGSDNYVPNGDPSRNDTLDLIIQVGDVNDVAPHFDDDVIFTSFMESNQVGDHLTEIQARDDDFNDSLTYTMHDDIQWFDTTFIPEGQPFTLDQKDDRSTYLTLNFDAKLMSQGYCNFTITVEDQFNHRAEAQLKVYAINQDYQVAMYFSNDVTEIKSQKSQIENIYSSVYNYKCTIDSIAATQDSTGQTLANKTTVYMHFIDEEKNEPVEDTIILSLSENAELMAQLLNRLTLIGIKLDSVDSYLPPTDEKTPEEQILVLQILLGVVSLVLGSLLVLLITMYCLRTNKLERKIKVLSTNTFGSKEAGLNNMGLEMDAVPGSNYLAKEHGNHNPVFSETEAFEFKNQDTGSISSGDSVLVGVEDNPEFKSYSAKKGTQASSSSSQGYENPSFGRSIDEVSAQPPGVQGGVKGNPLLNLGSMTDDMGPSAPSGEGAFEDFHGSEGDTTSLDQQVNSNFSFSS